MSCEATGERLSRDRDQDGVLDGTESALRYGTATPGCSGQPTLLANSEPFVGNAQFAFTMQNAQPNLIGVLALSLGPAQFTALGIEILIDPVSASNLTIISDMFGNSAQAFPLTNDPALSGLQIFGQAIWLDACGSEWFASSTGLSVTIRP